MGKVLAGITISVDGFITGPGDGPGCGLGVGGERLHYWVFGGPWSYDSPFMRLRPETRRWIVSLPGAGGLGSGEAGRSAAVALAERNVGVGASTASALM
jgi:hypothetical protein